MKGFKRETGWDKKRGKGVQGATTTQIGAPPCDGSIIIQLIGPGGIKADGSGSNDFADWDFFVLNALYLSVTQQQAAGLSIFHPMFASIGLTSVVVEWYTGPEYMGKGLYQCEIKVLEWQPPPPKNTVATVKSQKTDSSGGQNVSLPKPDPPEIAAAKQRNAAAHAATKPFP
jgi:hypothetical protein